MVCTKCGKEIEAGATLCSECGETAQQNIGNNTPDTNCPIDVFDITRVIAKGKLSVYPDRVEFAYNSDNQPVTETYHYFNIKNVSVDSGMKILSLVIETIDDVKMYFSIENENSAEVYNQKTEIINKAKAACPSLEALGLTEDDMKKELDENKEKRKGKAGKKAMNFLSEYKNFGALSTKSKIIHIAIPLIIIIALICIFSGGGVKDADYIDCAKSVASNYLKAPSTATYSDCEVVEKDDYGRALVFLTVESQNSFGAYVRTYFAVVIESYDKSTEEYTYSRFSVQHWTDSSHNEMGLELSKELGHWNEPLED